MEKNQNLKEWIYEAVAFFTEMGFLENLKEDTLEKTIQNIKAYVNENMNYELIHDDYDADLRLLLIDHKRISMILDDESFVTQATGIYKMMLERLSAIGRSIVQFQSIEESWENSEGPILLTFEYDDISHSIQIPYYGETPLFSFIEDLNRIIAETGYQFEIYYPEEAAVWGGFTTLLTAEEKKQLIEKREWILYTHEDLVKEDEAIKVRYLRKKR